LPFTFDAIAWPTLDDPDVCIVRTRQGERVPQVLATLLDPVDPSTFHEYVLSAGVPVELHGHDFDEYWWFTSGTPLVTLWTKAAGERQYLLQPGDLVVCPRGVAHTLYADHPLVYHQFSSLRRDDAREGHLLPEELRNASLG
jgi:mannose-6-phosphate isomerase-like protein (cupin superfamily)